MEGEDENGGLFDIELDPEDEKATDEKAEKVPRDFQSEEDFQRQAREWRPKVERGEIYKTVALPSANPSKPVSQTILHAIEELYFYRRYEEARRVAREALEAEGLIVEFRKTLEGYLEITIHDGLGLDVEVSAAPGGDVPKNISSDAY